MNILIVYSLMPFIHPFSGLTRKLAITGVLSFCCVITILWSFFVSAGISAAVITLITPPGDTSGIGTKFLFLSFSIIFIVTTLAASVEHDFTEYAKIIDRFVTFYFAYGWYTEYPVSMSNAECGSRNITVGRLPNFTTINMDIECYDLIGSDILSRAFVDFTQSSRLIECALTYKQSCVCNDRGIIRTKRRKYNANALLEF